MLFFAWLVFGPSSPDSYITRTPSRQLNEPVPLSLLFPHVPQATNPDLVRRARRVRGPLQRPSWGRLASLPSPRRPKTLTAVSSSSRCAATVLFLAPVGADPLTAAQGIADESKILFNIGLVQATIGSHELAVESFEAAIGLDQYLAVAYFQSGVSNFLLGRYEEARRDFDDAYSVRAWLPQREILQRTQQLTFSRMCSTCAPTSRSTTSSSFPSRTACKVLS